MKKTIVIATLSTVIVLLALTYSSRLIAERSIGANAGAKDPFAFDFEGKCFTYLEYESKDLKPCRRIRRDVFSPVAVPRRIEPQVARPVDNSYSLEMAELQSYTFAGSIETAKGKVKVFLMCEGEIKGASKGDVIDEKYLVLEAAQEHLKLALKENQDIFVIISSQ